MPLYMIMPDRDPLQDPLMFLAGGALIPLCKVALLDSLWGDPGPLFDTTRKSVDSYFHHFEAQCRLALYNWEKYDLSELRFRHVTDVAGMLKAGVERDDIERFLGEVLEGDLKIIVGEVVDLTVRLLLMVPVWNVWQGLRPGETSLTWVEGTLGGAVTRHFRGVKRLREKSDEYLPAMPQPQPRTTMSVQLEKSFTAMNIEEKADMRIVWTSNLLDHLMMRPEENTVAVFYHASFLSYQTQNPLYPPGFINETLRTLALLLPPSENNTRDWYLRRHVDLHLDMEAIRCQPLSREERNIERFDFWKDRLLDLKSVYDQTRPAQSRSLLRKCLSIVHLR